MDIIDDDITVDIMKLAVTQLAGPLCKLINNFETKRHSNPFKNTKVSDKCCQPTMSWAYNKPDELKIAKACPIYKKKSWSIPIFQLSLDLYITEFLKTLWEAGL